MASKKVTVNSVTFRGELKWRVRHWKAGKLCRPLFDSKKKADAKAAALRGELSHADSVWERLSDAERAKLIEIYEQKPTGLAPSLSTTIVELITAKRNAGRSDDYIDSLENILNQFAKGQGSTAVNAVTHTDIEKFLDSKKIESRSTLRARISTLFEFAIRRGYRPDNPCKRLESITVTAKPPAIFTVEQFKTAVKWLRGHSPASLPWFALSTACGLRPEEAEKTRKSDIHFGEGFIRVEAQTSKVRQRRVVYPKPEAVAFLKWALKHGSLPIDSQMRRRMISGVKWKSKDGPKRRPGLRHALGFKVWPKDITRHTAASYWLASDGSAAHVSEMLGNSEKVLKSHYKALVTQKEAEEFWKVVEKLSKAK